jgi:hypothetical protein
MILFSAIWPTLFLLALFVGGVHLVKYIVIRWTSQK